MSSGCSGERRSSYALPIDANPIAGVVGNVDRLLVFDVHNRVTRLHIIVSQHNGRPRRAADGRHPRRREASRSREFPTVEDENFNR